jgi:hypothetical protein
LDILAYRNNALDRGVKLVIGKNVTAHIIILRGLHGKPGFITLQQEWKDRLQLALGALQFALYPIRSKGTRRHDQKKRIA